jgi:hypothetical protein
MLAPAEALLICISLILEPWFAFQTISLQKRLFELSNPTVKSTQPLVTAQFLPVSEILLVYAYAEWLYMSVLSPESLNVMKTLPIYHGAIILF